jgi:hypothetical protein
MYVPIRAQRTGTSPSKRRWSEAAPMRAVSDRLISLHTARGPMIYELRVRRCVGRLPACGAA